MVKGHEGEPVVARISKGQRKILSEMREGSFGAIPEDPSEHRIVSRYPQLIKGDFRVRYNPYSGEIYIGTYREVRKGRELPKNSSGYIHVRGEIENGRPDRISELRWNKSISIENAILSAEDVSESYTGQGKQITRNKAAVSAINRIIRAFKSGDMTEEKLEALREETIQTLSRARFYDATKPIRREIALQVTSAADYDSLGRINKLISLSQASSALLKTTQEQIFAAFVRVKFPYLKDALKMEREIERFIMEQGIKIIDAVSESVEARSLTSAEPAIKRLQIFSRDNFSDFDNDVMKVSPYMFAARYANLLIVGKGNQDLRLPPPRSSSLRNFLDEESLEELFANDPLSIVYSDRNRSPELIRAEIKNRLSDAKNMLNTALEIGEARINREISPN